LEKELRASRDALIEFQRQNNLPAIEEAGNDAAKYLAELKRRLADTQHEIRLLQMLDIDQNIERSRQQSANAVAAAGSEMKDGEKTNADESATAETALLGPESQYLQARQQIQLLKAEREQWSRTHRPKHPIIQNLDREIRRTEELLDIFKNQAAEQLASRRKALELEARNFEAQIKEWEQRALEVSRSKAEYERLKANVNHIEQQYNNFATFQRNVDSVGSTGTEMVSIMERASPAIETRPPFLRALLLGLLAGLGAGALILFILDRLDDRMNSQSEFEARFKERVIGQIPQIDTRSVSTILQVNDERHSFAEAFRNVRSSIHFMPFEGERPRSFAITSATPGEGKSTTAANLGVTMAHAGSRTLIVDADLRRGTVHEQFKAESTPGLTEVLEGRHTWQELVLKTSLPNLHILTRGRAINEAGQLFMSGFFDRLLLEFLNHYDIILFDTPPVLAADDSTSLAPKVDATIFVVRLSQTLARQSRKALDLLYERQANVIGVILNCADPTMPEYKYYYQYSQYYYRDDKTGEERRRARRKKAAA
jgi:capsular exopolysaccharide synthesis family protein